MREDGSMTLTEFLLARIGERERAAQDLLSDLERQIEAEGFAADERGEFTPARMLSAQLWAHYDGQTRWRNFARGQHIASLADPARILAECAAKRAIIELHGVSDGEGYVGWYGDDEEPADGLACGTCGTVTEYAVRWPCPTVRLLAAIDADHPNYQPEWML